VCNNTHGSYACICNDGFTADTHTTCVDVDECAVGDKCDYGECKNEVGGFRCECQPGFEYYSWSDHCMDIDECITRQDDCGEHFDCINELGSFRCECILNYHLHAVSEKCEPMYVWHGNATQASWKAGGGFRTKLDGTAFDFYNMFDDDLDTFWLGELRSNGTAVSRNNLEVTFSSEVIFHKLELVSRPWGAQYIRDTYQNMCLLADSVPIMCTAADYETDVREVIRMSGGGIPATVIELVFQHGVPAQVADLKIYYSGDDECGDGTHTCDVHAICTNTARAFTCACPVGFTGDGFTCTGK